MMQLSLTIDAVTGFIKSNKSDREIVMMYRAEGYNVTAVWNIIQRCKIKMSRVRGANPGPVDPRHDSDLRVWVRGNP